MNYQLTDSDVAELRTMRNWMRNLRGRYIRNTPTGPVFDFPYVPPQARPADDLTVWVRITGTSLNSVSLNAGFYAGVIETGDTGTPGTGLTISPATADGAVVLIHAAGVALNTGDKAVGRVVGSAAHTDGTTWPLVRLANPSGLFAVKVEKDGGSNGTQSTTASYTYTVRSLGSASLGTTVALARPRPNGAVTYQAGSSGYGLAFYDGATLKLWDAGEIPDTGPCT